MSSIAFLIRGSIAVAALAALWLFTARWWSLALDLVYTAPMATLQSSPLGWNGIYLQFGSSVPGLIGPQGWSGDDLRVGSHLLDLSGPAPDYKPVALLTVDAKNQLVLSQGERHFVLGSGAGTMPGSDEAIPAFAADPGDATSLTLERSLLSWPTPFEFNFMTGHSPSWRRHLYYRLRWKKASGAQLQLVWRYEQGYQGVDGWLAPGGDGLIRVDITQPARKAAPKP